MTVLERGEASGFDTKGVLRYVVVAVVAAAIGVGLGWGITGVADEPTDAVPAAYARYSVVGEHIDDIWRTGLIQQEAVEARDAAARWRRALETRGAAMDEHLDQLMATGAATARAKEDPASN